MPAFAGMTNLLFASRHGISTIPKRDINAPNFVLFVSSW
jgi:hypothetical protein